ncbi:unnamed protein product [Prorocentrum cordatum]|uniref:Cyclic nucleotide-binding domain-containing protein n=1 Tax=Prorocentrum cordatum TaxID=2364126 RepID=A0ABN9RPZ2_9DINO|nr:unnamed protein product [Polarella glacialis]
MAAKHPTAEAFELHLQALTTSLDLQVNFVRSALDLHPASSLADFKKVAEEAMGKFSVAIEEFRSDLIVAAATAAGCGQPPATTDEPDAETPGTSTKASSNDRCFQACQSCTTKPTESIGPIPRRVSGLSAVTVRSRSASKSSRGSSASRSSSASHSERCRLPRRSTSARRTSIEKRSSARRSTGRSSFGEELGRESIGTGTSATEVPEFLLLGDHCVPNEVLRHAMGATVSGQSSTLSFGKSGVLCIDGVLNPDFSARLAWDLMVMLLVMCDSVVLPFQLAEFGTDPGFDALWLWLTVGAFMCDLMVNFCTGYRAGKNDAHLQEGTLVTDRISIAINYLRRWFWIDFLSTVPWSVIVDAFQSSNETDASSAGQVTKLAKIIKLMRLLRLMRMLRLCKLAVIWERFESRIGSSTALNVIAMLRVLCVWTTICHWGACVWWMVGRRGSLAMLLTMQDDVPEALHWTELPREHSRHDDFGEWKWVERPVSEQYVFCFYWILGVMRTMPSEVTPVNLIERVFVLLFMFFAVAAFAINVTRITQAWFKFSARSDAFKEEMAYVRMHLRSIKCGTKLQLRTQAYLRHLFEKRKLHAKELGLLNALPDGLKRKLSQATKIHYLRMLPRLEDWIDPALRHVCDAAEIVDYLPGDKLTEKDQPATAAHVLMRGGLQVYAPAPPHHRRRSSSSAAGALTRVSLSSDLCFGRLTVVDEHCLFERTEVSLSRDTVVALECSEVLRVDRHTFQETLRKLQELQDTQKRRRYEMQRILRNEGDCNLGGSSQDTAPFSPDSPSTPGYFGLKGKLLQRTGTMASRLSLHFGTAGMMSAG